VDGRVRRSASETVGEAVAQWKSKNLRQTWAQQKMSLTEPGGQLARWSIETRIALDLPTCDISVESARGLSRSTPIQFSLASSPRDPISIGKRDSGSEHQR